MRLRKTFPMICLLAFMGCTGKEEPAAQSADCPEGKVKVEDDDGRFICEDDPNSACGDEPCPDGFTCNADTGLCDEDSDEPSSDSCSPRCTDGKTCQNGLCITDDRCSQDSECARGEICVLDTCQPDEHQCDRDSDCGTGQICERERCVRDENVCTRDRDCEGDLTCESGECVEPEVCGRDSDCDDNKLCESGQCVYECGSDSDCRADQVCNADNECELEDACAEDRDCIVGEEICVQGFCEPDERECHNDDGCRPQVEICERDRCIPYIECVRDSQCPTGKVCESNDCVDEEDNSCRHPTDCTGDDVCYQGMCQGDPCTAPRVFEFPRSCVTPDNNPAGMSCDETNDCPGNLVCFDNACASDPCPEGQDFRDPNTCEPIECPAYAELVGDLCEDRCPTTMVWDPNRGDHGECRHDDFCMSTSECGDREVCLHDQCVSSDECTQDSHCEANEACNTDTGMCETTGCLEDRDCENEDERCEAGVCVVWHQCDNDDECLAGERCVNHICESNPPECVRHSQCDTEQYCDNGTCVDGCRNNLDCAGDDICTNNVCVSDVECTDDNECSATEICVEGNCEPDESECVRDTDCPNSDEVCERNRCIPYNPTPDDCTVNSDCVSGEWCDVRDQCVTCRRTEYFDENRRFCRSCPEGRISDFTGTGCQAGETQDSCQPHQRLDLDQDPPCVDHCDPSLVYDPDDPNECVDPDTGNPGPGDVCGDEPDEYEDSDGDCVVCRETSTQYFDTDALECVTCEDGYEVDNDACHLVCTDPDEHVVVNDDGDEECVDICPEHFEHDGSGGCDALPRNPCAPGEVVCLYDPDNDGKYEDLCYSNDYFLPTCQNCRGMAYQSDNMPGPDVFGASPSFPTSNGPVSTPNDVEQLYSDPADVEESYLGYELNGFTCHRGGPREGHARFTAISHLERDDETQLFNANTSNTSTWAWQQSCDLRNASNSLTSRVLMVTVPGGCRIDATWSRTAGWRARRENIPSGVEPCRDSTMTPDDAYYCR